jgi:hypothetical protein
MLRSPCHAGCLSTLTSLSALAQCRCAHPFLSRLSSLSLLCPFASRPPSPPQVLISINLFVHIFLYAYYGLYELQVDIWWKKYLTTVQITQFMVALLASVGAMLMRIVWTLTPRAWGLGYPCTGSWSGSYFGLAIIVSYLVLFVRLYQQKYKADEATAGKKGGTQAGRVAGSKALQQTTGAKVGSGRATSTSSTPTPDYSSTFSPHCKPTPIVTAGIATHEDLFAAQRTAWLAHPLLEADRQRWAQHAQREAEQPKGKPKAGVDLKLGVNKRATSNARGDHRL